MLEWQSHLIELLIEQCIKLLQLNRCAARSLCLSRVSTRPLAEPPSALDATGAFSAWLGLCRVRSPRYVRTSARRRRE